MESQKYKLGGSNDIVSGDGGTLATVYEKGSKLGLEPLDYGDPSLVGYWTFDEGTGTTAWDYSGNNASGTLIGSSTLPIWVSGKVGNGTLSFNGVDSYVASPNMLNNPTVITISVWIKLSTYPSGPRVGIVSTRNTTTGGGINFDISGTDCAPGKMYLIQNGGSGISSCGNVILNTGTWYYVVAVLNAQGGTLYLNGQQDSILSGSWTWGTGGSLSIGSVMPGIPYFFPGLIDDVRIYNRALSAAEISALYNGGK
jgi:hypothetical protein